MKKHKVPTINSHNSWSKLEEVWLGDVYPREWYDHLSSDVRDVFRQLTDITKQDLHTIQKTLESFDIVVQRPKYKHIDNFVNSNEQLIKPQICPRDHFVVVGNTLIGHEWHTSGNFQKAYNDIRDASWPDCVSVDDFAGLPTWIQKECTDQHNIYPSRYRTSAWQDIISEYRLDQHSKVITLPNGHCINGANVVRVGRDIIIDRDVFDYTYNNEFPEYRVQVVSNGGHMDGCFAILKPGLILANRYFDDYNRTFPGWKIIYLDNPTYGAAPSIGHQQPFPVYNGKFFNTAVGTNRMFNHHIIQHALEWVGNYTETYFELNCLVIDENNVVMLAENYELANDLVKENINVHWVPFRTRSFWDGGVHCLTVDIRRKSKIEDLFPERN